MSKELDLDVLRYYDVLNKKVEQVLNKETDNAISVTSIVNNIIKFNSEGHAKWGEEWRKRVDKLQNGKVREKLIRKYKLEKINNK